MTIIRHSDCPPTNAAMSEAGYQIIAVETYRWPDDVTETEALQGPSTHDPPPRATSQITQP